MPITINHCYCGENPRLDIIKKPQFQILCDNCGVGVYGTEPKEVIRKWNVLNGWQEDDDADNNQ